MTELELDEVAEGVARAACTLLPEGLSATVEWREVEPSAEERARGWGASAPSQSWLVIRSTSGAELLAEHVPFDGTQTEKVRQIAARAWTLSGRGGA